MPHEGNRNLHKCVIFIARNRAGKVIDTFFDSDAAQARLSS